MQRKLFALSHHGWHFGGSRQWRQLFFELRKQSVFEHNNDPNSEFPIKVWLEDNSSWSVPLQEILGVDSVSFHSSLFSLSYFYFSGFLANFSAS